MKYAMVKDGVVVGVAEVGDDDGGRSWLAAVKTQYDLVADVSDHRDAHGYPVNAGDTHSKADGFRPPQPFASWSWGGSSWEPPVAQPDDGGVHVWDEDAGAWDQIAPPPAA